MAAARSIDGDATTHKVLNFQPSSRSPANTRDDRLVVDDAIVVQ
jgi:hypothetical protein